MIRDISPTDNPAVVVAHGPRYDLEKVLDFAESLVRVFVGTISKVYREASPEIACGIAGNWSPLVEMEYMRMRTGFTVMQANEKGYDSGSFEYIIRIGPFKLCVGLLGKYGLYRRPDGTLETIDGQPAEAYDPAPEIAISGRWHPHGLLESDDASVALATMSRFIGPGFKRSGPVCVAGVSPPFIYYRFTHQVFGAGEGRIRIDCTDTE